MLSRQRGEQGHKQLVLRAGETLKSSPPVPPVAQTAAVLSLVRTLLQDSLGTISRVFVLFGEARQVSDSRRVVVWVF